MNACFTQLSGFIMGPFFWLTSKPGQPEKMRNGLLCVSAHEYQSHFAHFAEVKTSFYTMM